MKLTELERALLMDLIRTAYDDLKSSEDVSTALILLAEKLELPKSFVEQMYKDLEV